MTLTQPQRHHMTDPDPDSECYHLRVQLSRAPPQVNWIAEAPMRSVALSTWSEWSGGLRTSSLSVSVVDPARPHPWRDQTALFRHVTLVSCHRE